MPSVVKDFVEHWNRVFFLCVVRILSLDPSVSLHSYRKHKTLWRQWWILPSSPSRLLWNLPTDRGSVNCEYFHLLILKFQYILTLWLLSHIFSLPQFRECSIRKLVLILLVCQNVSVNIVFFVRISLSGFILLITLHSFIFSTNYTGI